MKKYHGLFGFAVFLLTAIFTITGCPMGSGDSLPDEVLFLSGTAVDTQAILAWADPADADLDHIEITLSPLVQSVAQPIGGQGNPDQYLHEPDQGNPYTHSV